MNLFQRLRLALRLFIHDLFGEDSAPATASVQERIDALLAEAGHRLEMLRAELAETAAREKRAEIEWRAAAAQAEALDAEVDAALRAGQEELARAKSIQLAPLKDRVNLLAEHHEHNRQATAQLQEAAAALQTRLEGAQRKHTELADRERIAETLEQLARLDRELQRNKALLSDGLGEREEQVARREDRLAALEEWRQK